MTEADRSLEGLLVPEYWGGHGFEDDCLWKNPRDFLDSISNIRVFRKELHESAKFARKVLEAYRGLSKPVAIRRFHEKELFDGANFPPGTVIRFEDETLSRNKKPKPKRVRRINLGIIYPVSQGQANQRILSVVPEDMFLLSLRRHSIRPVFLSHSSLITVGQVEHTRTMEGGGLLLGGLSVIEALRSRVDSLNRINWIEVLRSGEAAHEVLPQSHFLIRAL